jgi:hypothetical protein
MEPTLKLLCQVGENTLAYLASSLVTKKKSFVTFQPAVDFIKLIYFMSDKECEKARVLIPSKPFQPSITFESKDGSYTKGP